MHYKYESHWTKVILTDSAFPIAAKQFAFGFETTDLHNLLNIEYSIINNQGKLLEFKQGEDKIPALSFTIQVIWNVESQKKKEKKKIEILLKIKVKATI